MPNANSWEFLNTEQQCKDYMMERWNKSSLTEFDDDELGEIYQYASSPNPKFTTFKPHPKSEQELREDALLRHIEHLEATTSYFNRDAIRMTREDMFYQLAKKEPTLFGKMAFPTFIRFWAKQKICKLTSGKPRKGDL